MARTILITGATSGIGKATAELLAREAGTRLILTGRRAEKLTEVAAALPCETLLLNFDVRDHAATLAALRSLPEAWSSIDVLVNNAGLSLGLESFEQAEYDDWQVMVDTNIMGLLSMTREILPAMRARGRGHIINLSSIAGTYHYPGAHVYGASKAFVTYLSLALRADLLGSPVRVTSIEPGMTDTEFSLVRFKGDETRAAAVYHNAEPLHAADIAETIRWAIAQPPHVNINRIEIMATCQAPGGLKVHRG
ncbi:MAG: SDR family NAD(P)-dependent oxidoreductase [Alphaproteobacteria bacterium]|nr:SDR family NAD(P)-dependent oxidoreductase [Alphaproteobacteria bacterium]